MMEYAPVLLLPAGLSHAKTGILLDYAREG